MANGIKRADSERRITQRIASYWESALDGKPVPQQAIAEKRTVAGLEDVWDDCFVISIEEISPGANNYHFSHLGINIRHAYDDHNLQDGDGPPLVSKRASRLHAACREIALTHRPLSWEGEFKNKYGKTVRYRQCLVPFTNSKQQVTAVLGGMRYKLTA